jgi:hypothetical protein
MAQPLPGLACAHDWSAGLPNNGMLGSLQHIEQVPQFRCGTTRRSMLVSSAC